MKNEKVEEELSIWKFFLTVLTTFALAIGIMWICTSHKVFASQFYASPWYWYVLKAAIIFLVSQKFNCFAEWFFHRYMLHAPLVPGFGRMFHQHHNIHHKRTNIRDIIRDEKHIWDNNYAMKMAYQFVASFFPFYSYAGFLVVCSPIIVVIQLLLPSWPIALWMTFSVGWSLTAYELIHKVEHLPMETFWEPLAAKARNITGKMWAEKTVWAVYSFHEYHHARIKCNEAVSGFLCGLPLADLVFGTLKFTTRPLRNGKLVESRDLVVPRPYFGFIRFLDECAEKSLLRRGKLGYM